MKKSEGSQEIDTGVKGGKKKQKLREAQG